MTIGYEYIPEWRCPVCSATRLYERAYENSPSLYTCDNCGGTWSHRDLVFVAFRKGYSDGKAMQVKAKGKSQAAKEALG